MYFGRNLPGTEYKLEMTWKGRRCMKQFWYTVLQILWGFPQTLLGFAVFLRLRKATHYRYHGAVVTEWKKRTGMSLGLFLFVPEGDYGKDFLVHEYGHTIQSLLLGPLYLVVIGVPSVLWCNLRCFINFRRKKCISYQKLYAERWANHLGEKITGEKVRL